MSATGRRSRWLAISVVAVSVGLTIAATVILLLAGRPLFDGFNGILIIAGTVYAVIGGLIAVRLPANRIGWVLVWGSLFWAIAYFVNQYAWWVTYTLDGALPGALLVAWIGTWIWIPGEVLLLVALPLLFPDGHLPSPRWRWLVGLIAVGAVVTMASQAIGLVPHGETAAEYLAEPLDGTTLPGLIGAMNQAGQLVTGLVGPLAATTAIVLRLRRSVGVERQQMRWFTYAIAVAVVGLILDEVVLPGVGAGKVVSTLGILLIPIALGVSIFRYRLYEIDRIISRTVGYAAISVTLAIVFIGVVLGLTAFLGSVTGGNTVAVAASTLIVAALFQPLRRRVQSIVDRRFNRARYDAQRMVDAFSERLRDEVDIMNVTDDLDGTITSALNPSTFRMWLRNSIE